MSLGGKREPLFQVEGAWPEEAIHVEWSEGAREHYASEISDRKLP